MKTMPEGMYESERCKFCHDFGPKVRPRVCGDCFAMALELAASEGWTPPDTGALFDAAADVRAMREEGFPDAV